MLTWIAVLPVAAVLYGLLVPDHGAVGAAIASSASYALAAVISGTFLLRDRRRDAAR
jgi:O-antigen/teichoic acid export membrane protein